MGNPRVLVISNNCFSKSGSNGRTLGNFFEGWDKEALAQFYIHNETPDSEVCDKYYRVTDSEALKAFLKNKKVGGQVKRGKQPINLATSVEGKKKIKRTATSMILRDLVWGSNRWINNSFNEWINNFNPEVIVFQAGDSKFMNDLAVKIAKERKIPIVIYNSEGYYLKEKNYLEKNWSDFISYPIFKKRFNKSFELLMKETKHSIYNSEILKIDYDMKFLQESSVIMTSSSIEKIYIEKKDNKIEEINISYLGNLGLNRDISLIEVANALASINKKLNLEVYGKITNESTQSKFKECSNLIYKGLIPYDEVLSVIKKSDLLIHIESFDDFYRWDLKYGFSTKIADSLSSSACFCVYAPEELASSQYLINNKCACVITNKEDLQKELNELLNNFELRKSFVEKALEIAKKNHNEEINKETFEKIINLARKS